MSLLCSCVTAASAVGVALIANPLSPVPSGSRYVAGGPATATFQILATGAWNHSASGTTGNSGNWVTGTFTASDYQVRLTPTSGSFTSNTASSFVSLGSTQTATVTRGASAGVTTIVYTVEIRRTSDSVVVSTTTGCQLVADTG
jgi:hypothetical protein